MTVKADQRTTNCPSVGEGTGTYIFVSIAEMRELRLRLGTSLLRSTYFGASHIHQKRVWVWCVRHQEGCAREPEPKSQSGTDEVW